MPKYQCIAAFYGEEALVQKELLEEQGFEEYIENIDVGQGEILNYMPRDGKEFGHYVLVEHNSIEIYQSII